MHWSKILVNVWSEHKEISNNRTEIIVNMVIIFFRDCKHKDYKKGWEKKTTLHKESQLKLRGQNER